MITIVLMTVLNILLFMGMNEGNDNALNVAVFIMWILAIASALTMFISDQKLLMTPEKHFIYRWFIRIFIIATITNSIYWGYFWAPSVLLISVVVLWARKYELNSRKRF